MKILFLSDDFPPEIYGGAGMVACNLAVEMSKKGHDVFVVTTVQDRSKEGVGEYMGLKIFKIYSSYHISLRAYLSLYNPLVIGKFRKLISEIMPDIVHAHNIHQHLSYGTLKISKTAGAQVFLTVQDVLLFHYGKLAGYDEESKQNKKNNKVSVWNQIQFAGKRYNPFRNFAIRYYLKYVVKIFTVSHALEKVLKENGLKNVEVVHSCIDASKWSVDIQDENHFKDLYGLNGKKIVFFGGRLSTTKGAYQTLLALEHVSKRVKNVVLLVAGLKDAYAGKMEEIAKEKGIKDKIIFTGWLNRDEIVRAYSVADVCLVPSIYIDPFPTITLEAMASRKPVIGTCFGGTKELIVDGKTGYVVNPFDIEEMSHKLVELLTNDQKALQFGEAGYQRVVKDFSIVHQADIVLSRYTAAIRKSKN